MESKWYLYHGQTIENTRISDRSRALHITQTNWNGILKHLDRDKLLQEELDKNVAVKKYLDEGSKNMTKEWANSIENIRKRKKEERQRLIQQDHEERLERLRRESMARADLRAENLEKIKKQIFMTSGYAKDLTSALVASEVLYEREKQIEHQKLIKQQEDKVDQKYLKMLLETANKEDAEDAEDKRIWIEKEKKYASELKKMIEERAALKKNSRDQRIKKEISDNIAAEKEIEKLNKSLKEDKLRKMKELAEEKKKNLIIEKDLKLQKIAEDEELDEIVQIYSDAKHRIECLKKQREEDMRNEAVKRREKISAMVMAEEMDRSEAENRIIREAIAKRDAAEAEKVRARKEFDERAIQERLKDREEYLDRQAANKTKEEELRRWEVLNRYKTYEIRKEFEDNRKKQMWQEVLKYRQELIEQMEDDKLKQMKENESSYDCANTSVEDKHAKFFKYADEVLQLAKKNGRNTIPIETVIAKYVKEMNINVETQGEVTNDSESNRSSDDLKKQLIKPRKPRLCRCRCEKS